MQHAAPPAKLSSVRRHCVAGPSGRRKEGGQTMARWARCQRSPSVLGWFWFGICFSTPFDFKNNNSHG